MALTSKCNIPAIGRLKKRDIMFGITERLLLRPAWSEDARPLFEAINDEAIIRNLARVPWPYSIDDAHNFIAIKPNPTVPNFMLLRCRDGISELIGSCGLAKYHGKIELGYWIARQHWGAGYATEAANAVMRIAASLGHSKLNAGYFADNPASGRVLRKNGFVQSGPIRQEFSLGRNCKSDFIPMIADDLAAILAQTMAESNI